MARSLPPPRVVVWRCHRAHPAPRSLVPGYLGIWPCDVAACCPAADQSRHRSTRSASKMAFTEWVESPDETPVANSILGPLPRGRVPATGGTACQDREESRGKWPGLPNRRSNGIRRSRAGNGPAITSLIPPRKAFAPDRDASPDRPASVWRQAEQRKHGTH